MYSGESSEVDNTDSDPDFNFEDDANEPLKTRKRKRNFEKWVQNVRKRNRNEGKQYVSKKGTIVPPRATSNCDCKRKCSSKFSGEDKVNILKNFNDLKDKNVQDAYLSGIIRVKPIARRRTNKQKDRPLQENNRPNDLVSSDEEAVPIEHRPTTFKRKVSFKYVVNIHCQEYEVCKTAFCGLHGIKKARVERLGNHKSKPGHSTPPIDRRGKSEGSRRNMSENLVNQVKGHINSFPKRISHYSRRHSGKKYLPSDLNVSKMHDLYLEKHEPEIFQKIKNGEKCKPKISYEYYNYLFNTHFNLSFGSPRTDVCDVCDHFVVQIQNEKDEMIKKSLELKKNIHLAKAEKFYDDLKEKIKLAKEDSSVETICFDYQQNLPIPVLPVGEIFYSRQVWVFNQCFTSAKEGKSKMYMFDETTAKKGANETASFLHHYIDNFLSKDVKKLYLFADNCTGQNKNKLLLMFLSYIAALNRFELVQMHFPEPGHSFLPCDRNFANIEKAKRHKEYIFLPEQWYSLVQQASKKAMFQVIKVVQPMVKNYSEYLTPFFKKKIKNASGYFTISKYRVFQFKGKQINVCISHDLDMNRETFVALEENVDIQDFSDLSLLYTRPVPIKPKKLEDVKKLAEKFVPQIYQHYYFSLEALQAVALEEDSDEDYDD